MILASPTDFETGDGPSSSLPHDTTTFDQPRLTVDELLAASRLDYPVRLAAVRTDDGTPVPHKRAVIREDTGGVLGVVGKNYVPVQNSQAFLFLNELVRDGSLYAHRAGSFRGGARVWVQAKLPSTIRVRQSDDLVDEYLLLCNTFDGSSALRILFTPVRIVCENSLNLAIRRGMGQGISIRHRGNLASKIQETRRVLGMATEFFDDASERINRLAAHSPSSAQLEGYFQSLYPDPDQGDKAKASGVRHRLMDLFETGKGMDIPAVRHSTWAAYNAVTEWVDHHRPTRASSPAQRATQRLDSAWFGSGAALKAKAWNLALDMALAV
jgi:phage/plasmid-like protein (TIGR03299 family)